MKLLPPVTPPFSERLERLHAPLPWAGEHGWKGFRECLRWEFGFTCAICQLHEADFVPPTTRPGGLSIEHYLARSSDSGKGNENRYENCLWICARCNETRGDRPHTRAQDGARLLHPISDVWNAHFQRTGHDLLPQEGDSDAEYTASTYGINREVRRQLRRFRERETAEIRDSIELLHNQIDAFDNELAIAPDRSQATWLLRGRNRLVEKLRWNLEKLRHFSAIPEGAPVRCRCAAGLAPAAAVASQWLDFDLPGIPAPVPSPKKRFRA